MKQLETDVVVVGAGAAGSAAALSAAENGIRVLVLDGSAEPEGPVKGGNGIFAVGSRLQEEKKVALNCEQAFHKMMEFTHWQTDARLMGDYLRKSADTVAWLEDMGIRFSDIVAYYKGADYTWHFKDENCPSIPGAIFKRATEYHNVTMMMLTKATRIKKEGGLVTGVWAVSEHDGELDITAKAVILATGGIGSNRQMAMDQTGYKIGENVFCFEFPQVDGSGLRMAWEAGAGHTNVLMDTYVSLPNPFAGPGGTLYELGSFRQPNLMINAEGERFMDEAVMRMPSYAGNAVKRQTGGCAYMLFDERINRYYQDNRWDHYISGIGYDRSGNISPFIQKAMSDGEKHLCVADTLDDAADFMGINKTNLKVTVQAYNAMCAAGSDTLFYKQREYLRPLSEPPFYAARFYVSAYGTLGGIAVNYRTEVLNESREVIPGLYAIGNDANALYGDTYPFFFSGNTSAFCYNSGRIAGENASVFVKKLRII